MPKVVNVRESGRSGPNLVYVGRPSYWGNPFIIGEHGTREEVIDKFRIRLLGSPKMLARLSELRGKDLSCWCAPEPCHADILLELANDEGISIV